MLTQEQAGDIFDRIKKLSSADEVEVLFSGGRFALTRFANNTIHQNVAEENYVVSVRTAFGGRTARAFTNKFDEESLRQVVRSAESLAKVQHPDPDLLPMPDPGEASGSAGGGARATYTTPSRSFSRDCEQSLLNCGLKASRRLSAWRTGTNSRPPEFIPAPKLWMESSTRAG